MLEKERDSEFEEVIVSWERSQRVENVDSVGVVTENE
jgi:hypothetical protein